MVTTLGLECEAHSLTDVDRANCWHVVNLTLGEVHVLLAALSESDDAKAIPLRIALATALSDSHDIPTDR